MTTNTDGSSVDQLPTTYPHAGRRYAFKTIQCRLDREDVAAARTAVDSLFEQYAVAVKFFLGLMPVRAAYRDAFRKEDMAAAKAIAPGLEPGVRSCALDKAIEMWRSFEAKGGTNYGSRTGIPGSNGQNGAKDASSKRQSNERNGRNGLGHTAVRFQRKDLILVVEGDIASGIVKVSIPTPERAVELRIMGEDFQIPILRKVLKGEEGLIRCVSELLWRPSRKHGKRARALTNGLDLCLDIHIGRPMNRTAQDLPNVPGPAQMFVPIGVDIGVRYILVAATPGKGSKGVLFVRGGAWREKRRRFAQAQSLRRDLGDDKGWAASRTAEGNYVRDMAHQASRELLDMAANIADRSKGEVPVIVMEDLEFGGPDDKSSDFRKEQAQELDAWPRTLLQDIIIEKAAWEGIAVMLVAPAGTSIACPRCGSPDAVRKRDVHRLVCPDCTYKANDDYCAALNIAKRGLEKLLRDREAAFGLRAHQRAHDHELRNVMCIADSGAVDAPEGAERVWSGGTTRA